jgi:endonuclease YncB( thermonuclease family)
MELEKGELWSGYVKNVVDGDTVDVRFNIYGIQRVRLVGINALEIGEEGYEEAKEFVNKTCMMCEFYSVPFPKLSLVYIKFGP